MRRACSIMTSTCV